MLFGVIASGHGALGLQLRLGLVCVWQQVRSHRQHCLENTLARDLRHAVFRREVSQKPKVEAKHKSLFKMSTKPDTWEKRS